jgi:hypothetical protein
MKKAVLLSVISMILLISCATNQKTSYATVGAIHLPEPEVRLKLTFEREDLELLGNIDIRRKIAMSGYSAPAGKDAVLESKIGLLLNGSLPLIVYLSPSSSWSAGSSREQEIVRLLTYEAIQQYPDMDYMLFPRVYVERSTERLDFISSREYLDIRLTGRAVRITGF